MLRSIFMTTIVLLTAVVAPALAGEKEDVVAAAQKLVDASNYSWTTTSEGGGGGGGGGLAAGGASGKTQKDGLTMLILDLRDAQAQVFIKGDKAAVETPDDGWQAVNAADAGPDRRGGPRDPNAPGAGAPGAGGPGAGGGGPGGDGPNPVRMVANMIRTYQPPAAQALHLAGKAQDLKKSDDGAFTGTLGEDDAKALIQRRVGRRMANDGQSGAGGAPGGGGGRGAGGPDVKDPHATVTFWTDNTGQLTKFQFNVQSKMTTRDGEEREINRMTTVEFADVGTTKIDVPEEAKAKLD